MNLPRNAPRWIVLVALTAALALHQTRAADETSTNPPAATTAKPAEVADQLKALRKQIDEVDAASQAYFKETNETVADELFATYGKNSDAVAAQILDLVPRAPVSPVTFDLLEWLVTSPRASMPAIATNLQPVVDFLRNHYSASTNIGKICWTMGDRMWLFRKPGQQFLEVAQAMNPDRTMRGYAAYALAEVRKDMAEALMYLEAEPHSRTPEPAQEKAKAELLAEAKTADATIVFKQAEDMFADVIKQYGDCPNFPSGPGPRRQVPTLGDLAKKDLYECQHLVPGKMVPEIVGEDLDGKPLKLSDQHGKVVMLTFWASWCGPCMAMVDGERKIAERFKDKPFVMIGVNGDRDRKAAKSAVEKEQMTWRSFWCEGPDGAIPKAWNLSGWPTVYFIDPKGVIRFKTVGFGPNSRNLMTTQVARLLAESEKK